MRWGAVVTSSLPVTYDLTVYTNTTFKASFRWLPDGSTEQDFTGWSALMYIGYGQGPSILQLSSTAGIFLSPLGGITITMTPAMTQLLKPGTYAYVLDLTDPDATVQRFLRGQLRVIKDVGP